MNQADSRVRHARRVSLGMAIATAVAGTALPASTSLTHVRASDGLCFIAASGWVHHPNSSELYPKWGGRFGANCSTGDPTLVLSVTHESASNNHSGARNFSEDAHTYVGDFDVGADFGQWLDAGVTKDAGSTFWYLNLDSANYDRVNSVTGWPLRYGHLFAGLGDNSAVFSLDRNSVVEFDLRVPKSIIGAPGFSAYSGRRVILGALAQWSERPNRSNKSHFLEVDLLISDGYAAQYHQKPKPMCAGYAYDRCFYSDDGTGPEGREVNYAKAFKAAQSSFGPDKWLHVRLPLSLLYQKLEWVSPPAHWSEAKVSGLYIAIESVGATETDIQVRNYRVVDASQGSVS
jgi:hypothetical protein